MSILGKGLNSKNLLVFAKLICLPWKILDWPAHFNVRNEQSGDPQLRWRCERP